MSRVRKLSSDSTEAGDERKRLFRERDDEWKRAVSLVRAAAAANCDLAPPDDVTLPPPPPQIDDPEPQQRPSFSAAARPAALAWLGSSILGGAPREATLLQRLQTARGQNDADDGAASEETRQESSSFRNNTTAESEREDSDSARSAGVRVGGRLAPRAAAANTHTGTTPNPLAASYEETIEKAPKEETLSPRMLEPSSLRRRKLLVLLDMNGTLLVRARRHLASKTGRRPDHSDKAQHYYLREHARALCEALAARRDRGHLDFAFYTSMTDRKAIPAVRALCGGQNVSSSSSSSSSSKDRRNGANHHSFTAELYGREWNKDDPLPGGNKWDTMRDLEKLWATAGKVAHGYDATNTLVIDDTPRKMREHPFNVLVLPTYTEGAVVRGTDTVLVHLLRYLDDVLHHLFSVINTEDGVSSSGERRRRRRQGMDDDESDYVLDDDDNYEREDLSFSASHAPLRDVRDFVRATPFAPPDGSFFVDDDDDAVDSNPETTDAGTSKGTTRAYPPKPSPSKHHHHHHHQHKKPASGHHRQHSSGDGKRTDGYTT